MRMMSSHRINVIGSSGFIGSNVLASLQALGLPVAGYASKDLDLLNKSAIAASGELFGQNCFFIFCSAVGRTTDNSLASLLANVSMADNFLSQMPVKPHGILYLSTIDVYGERSCKAGHKENALPYPTDYYGVSKLACEHLFLGRGRSLSPVTILRLPGVFGPADRGNSVIGKMTTSALERRVVRVTNGGRTLRHYLYVKDLCAIIHRLLTQCSDGIFNCCPAECLPLSSYARMVGQAVGDDVEIVAEDAPDSRSYHCCIDGSKLLSQLAGLRLKAPSDSIREYVAWRTNP